MDHLKNGVVDAIVGEANERCALDDVVVYAGRLTYIYMNSGPTNTGYAHICPFGCEEEHKCGGNVECEYDHLFHQLAPLN